MKRVIVFILFVSNTLICQNIKSNFPNNKFVTIEDIKLGLSKLEYTSELKSLSIKNKNFSTNLFLRNNLIDENDKELNLINSYYTDAFNFDDYKVLSNQIEHPSLIHTESIDNKHISSIILLLGHTGKAVGLPKKDSLSSGVMYFRQDINQDLFFNIVDLYIHKYGEPEMVKDSTQHIKYYKLYMNNITNEKEDSYSNVILKWDTEFFKIEIFPGFNNNAFFIPNETYSTSTNWAFSNLDEKPLEYNQKPCFTFPYIKYQLNEKAIKMLITNKLKI
jgi:hypothetical protein